MIVTSDRRRSTPSYTIPFVFEGLEMLLIWIVFSIMEGSLNISSWSVVSYILAFGWFMYTVHKLTRVLSRQKQ